MKMNRRHNIAFLGFDRIQLLDLVGPLEAFTTANSVVDGREYNCFIVSENQSFTSESQIRVLSDYQITDTPKIDTLIIPGGAGTRDPAIASQIRHWVDQNFEAIPRIVTICTGLFMVADHPFLANKEVVTHWAFAEQLQKQFPELKVNHDRLFIQQGKFCSSAGILSGIDLALNLIETDHGVDAATKVAKYMVTYLKRSGHQSQFSEPLKFQSSNNSHIEQVNCWLTENHSASVTVAQLADSVHVSERHLNRLIKTHFHMSAGKYIEHVKLEQSKIYLSKHETPIEVAAHKVGYSSSDAFRRSFKRKYGISPHSYQLRFQG